MAPRGATKERILRVSKTLFAARGYEHASTSSIAREAGTSESQLMKHFGSKAGLLDAIFAESWSKITAEAMQAAETAPSPYEKLTLISSLVVEAIDRDPELKLLMLLEGRRIRREGQMITFAEGFMSFVRFVDSILEDIRAAGQLREGLSPQAVRSGLMGMLEGMLRDRFLAERSGYPADFEAREIGEMLAVALTSCVRPATAEAA